MWEYQSNTTHAGKKISSPWSQGNSWQENHQNKQPPSLSPSSPLQFTLLPFRFPRFFLRIPFPKKRSERHFFCGFQNWCSFPSQSLADLILTLTYLFSLSKFQVWCSRSVTGRRTDQFPHPRKFWTGPKMKHVWGIQSEIAYVLRKFLDDFIKLSFGEE